MLPASTLLSLLAVIIFNRRLEAVLAQMQPTTPGPGETYTAGADCTIAWVPDSSGTWTNVTIDLMSGSNNNMSLVTNVASGLDGTDESLTPFLWMCPEVDPYSTIYFYQFTNGDDISTRAWTTRFTIASPANETEAPENPQQPDGVSIPWGIGRLSVSGKSAANSTNSPSVSRSGATHPSATAPYSAAPSNGTKPHGRKGHDANGDEDASQSYPDDDDQGWDGGNSADGYEESTAKPPTRTRPANISAAKSAAARATAIAQSQDGTPPPDDTDESSGRADNGASRTHHDSTSKSDPDTYSDSSEEGEGEYQAQSPASDPSTDSNSYQYPRYKNSGAADAADSAHAAASSCPCYGAASENDALSTQLELSTSAVVSTIGPSVLIALVVLRL